MSFETLFQFVKNVFDLLDYVLYRGGFFALAVLGVLALIRWHKKTDSNN